MPAAVHERVRYGQLLGATVAVVAILKDVLFFSVSGLVGYQYSGAGESVAWMAIVVVAFAVTLAAYGLACVRSPTLTRLEIVFYGFIALMLGNHLVWWMTDLSVDGLLPESLVHFVAFSVPGVMAVRVLLAFDAWRLSIRVVHLAAVLMASGIAASVLLPFALGQGEIMVASGFSTLGGATAQSASYFAAFVFGLLGYYLFRAEAPQRLPLLAGPAGRALQLALWACMGMATVLNGGRGGLLLLLVYLAQQTYWFSVGRKLTYASLLRVAALLVVLPGMLGVLYATLESSEIFGIGFRRALDVFFLLTGSDVVSVADATSNRDQVYVIAVDGIARSPLLGYGAFGHWTRVIQPHNLFLDLALQFGLPLASALVLAAAALFVKNVRLFGPERAFFLVLGAYPLVLVMFSSGYFLQPLLWVSVAGLVLPLGAVAAPDPIVVPARGRTGPEWSPA